MGDALIGGKVKMKTPSLFCTVLVSVVMLGSTIARAGSSIEFDLPPTAAAVTSDPSDRSLVTVELRLSSMIDVAHRLKVDQWIVRCQPRDSRLVLTDYAPRTETSSQVSSPIQVKTTNESSNAFGASIDGGYGHVATGHAGIDNVDKEIHSLQYDQVAPHQVVVAAGTIQRGRGVYFKLRSTAEQVLEGEKRFSVTFRVPPQWRGTLLDVSVEAQVVKRSFNPWDHETKTVGGESFVVAVYRAGDEQAQSIAVALADAERALRDLNVELQSSRSLVSLPSVFRQVAMSFDGDNDVSWLQRLLAEQADPHLDHQIRELPMNVRVAVLDYADLRDDFFALNK